MDGEALERWASFAWADSRPTRMGTSRASFEQKGVGTLMVPDLLRMAEQGAFDIAVIIAGDWDLAEALRVVADDYARRVLLYEVPGSEAHKELRHVADDFGTCQPVRGS